MNSYLRTIKKANTCGQLIPKGYGLHLRKASALHCLLATHQKGETVKRQDYHHFWNLKIDLETNKVFSFSVQGAYGGGGGRFPLQTRSPGPPQQSGYQNAGQQQQMQRLQRSTSTPSATGQLPGKSRKS